MDLKEQYFGTEIEMTGITREEAANAVGELFGTQPYYIGTYYSTWGVRDLEGKEWKFTYDGSIHTQRRNGNRYVLWSSIFVTLMANKIGGLQFGIYRNCQISSRVFHTAVAALPLTKANRSDFE